MSQKSTQGRPVWMSGNRPAIWMAITVMLSVERLTAVRQRWRKRNRIADTRVPATAMLEHGRGGDSLQFGDLGLPEGVEIGRFGGRDRDVLPIIGGAAIGLLAVVGDAQQHGTCLLYTSRVLHRACRAE